MRVLHYWVERTLQIYPKEIPPLARLTALFLFLFLAIGLFQTQVDTYFLKRHGPGLMPALLVTKSVLSFCILRGLDGISLIKPAYSLVYVLLLAYAGIVPPCIAMMDRTAFMPYAVLFVLSQVLVTILPIYLWNICVEMFSVRQGPRLFPIITVGELVGTAAGGFLAEPVLVRLGPSMPSVFLAAVFLAAAAVIRLTQAAWKGPQTQPQASGRDDPGNVKSRGLLRLAGEFPIIRYLILTGLIPSILTPMVFFQFSASANETFTSEQSLVWFLGTMRGAVSLLTLGALFFVGRLLVVIGIPNASLVSPVNFSAVFAALLGFFQIYGTAYAYLSTYFIGRTTALPLRRALYNAVPSELSASSRTALRGTVIVVGTLVGSVVLVLLFPILGAKYLSAVGLALSLYWLYETIRFKRKYPAILKQALLDKQLDYDLMETAHKNQLALRAAPPVVEYEYETGNWENASPHQIPLHVDQHFGLDSRRRAAARERTPPGLTPETLRSLETVPRLVQRLDQGPERFRMAAMWSLTSYGPTILPFLEQALTRTGMRGNQAILEIFRLTDASGFQAFAFAWEQVGAAYRILAALDALQPLGDHESVNLLRMRLQESLDAVLNLVFQAFWVHHADMRLLYKSLKSETAAVAVEMVENLLEPEISRYVVPLIDDIPLAKRLELGKDLYPTAAETTPELTLHRLCNADDPVTRSLALFVIARRMPLPMFVPIVEYASADPSPDVRELARYAAYRFEGKEAAVPLVIERVQRLAEFQIFRGLGVMELHAIASIITEKTFSEGDVIIREDGKNSAVYLLVSGAVLVYEGYGTPQQREKACITPGGFFGELSFLTGKPPIATCVAMGPAETFALRHHEFSELLLIYPQIPINLCRFLAENLVRKGY